MKQGFKFYMAIWAVFLIFFHVIVFVMPREGGIQRAGASFWLGYVLILAAFLGHLACAWRVLRQECKRKLFYHVPIVTISYAGLFVSVAAGAFCMAIPDFPIWAGILVCAAVSAFTAVSVLKAAAVAELVQDMDGKNKQRTLFLRSLTVDAESLLAHAAVPELKKTLQEVYEAVRYSDPMSHGALAGVEGQITVKFSELSKAVDAQEPEAAERAAEELKVLLSDRNKKCKLLK